MTRRSPALLSVLSLAIPFAAALSVLVACHSASGRAAGERDYALVYLVTGPATNLPAEQQREVFQGHFANMERLAREGALLVAGPFGQRRSDPALRGLFVLDAADRQSARVLAETDPGFQAGVFALDYHTLSTAAPLRAFLDLELGELDAARAAGRPPAPGANGRGFVLLIGSDGERICTVLRDHPAVLLCGRLDGTGAFAVLDAVDLAAAGQALGDVRARLGEHHLEEWFASRNLERLPRL
jgi:uncharacterized protein YciI